MYMYLFALLFSCSTALIAMDVNNMPKPGDQVILQQGQKLVPFIALTERPLLNDMVAIKWGSEPGYMWGQVLEIVNTNVILKYGGLDDQGVVVERYILAHKIKTDGKRIGSHHLT